MLHKYFTCVALIDLWTASDDVNDVTHNDITTISLYVAVHGI